MCLNPILNNEYQPVIQGAGVIIQSIPMPYVYDAMIWDMFVVGEEIAAHIEQEGQ